MATYDYTGDGDGSIQSEAYRNGKFLAKVKLKVADIIASDTTLTTNGTLAINDIVEFIDMPAGAVFTDFAMKTVTTGTAALTADFGLAGGTQIGAAFDMAQAADKIDLMAFNATWGKGALMGYDFETADTIDVQFLIAAAIIGEWHVYIGGYFLY